MDRRQRTLIAIAAGIVVILVAGIGYARWVFGYQDRSVAAQQIAHPAPIGDLLKPIPDSAPNAVQLRQGQYLVTAGDCVSCHTPEGGKPFSGGYALNSPFGVIYTENLTSDKATGIGDWTPDQFYKAIHAGIGAHGEHLYPGLPYAYFTHMTRADSDAMLAFLKTVPPVSATPPPNDLPFPLNLRIVNMFWNWLNFTPGEYADDGTKSAEWNRGAYLVTGPGHCGACHTPKNWTAGDENDRYLQGGQLDNWVAPDLTGNSRTGLGRWSADDIVEYLRTGRNAHANAGGTMAEVVTNSTAAMTDADLHAIAVYLKSQPASPDASPPTPEAGAMARGAAVYSDACTACHMEKGVGQARFFPPLGGNAVVQQADPTSIVHMILAGDRTATTPRRPTPLTMPSFAWKLTDRQIADVATYVRNSWGNGAAPVDVGVVARLRRRLGLEQTHLTDNSTDR